MRDPTDGQRTQRVAEGDPGHWFEEVAEHLGAAYLRYSFTYGTVSEVDALVETLGLVPGQRILDVLWAGSPCPRTSPQGTGGSGDRHL